MEVDEAKRLKELEPRTTHNQLVFASGSEPPSALNEG
jgi:hypothetical protein